MDRYPTTYSDQRGSEETVITNDGATLKMVLRGLTFSGGDFDCFEPPVTTTPDQLKTFSFSHGTLCAYRLHCTMPLTVQESAGQCQGTLTMDLIIGSPNEKGRLNRFELQLVLSHRQKKYRGSGKSSWFEDELNDIQRQLPVGTFMRACINCQFSDYSPYGNAMFGTMMCFRDLKQDYLKVTSKDDFWPVHDRCKRQVQETFLCSEFQRRHPDTGYRG